ncbi:MAG: DUF4369 domain-containing protein [Phocaeicola sp.]
MKRNCLFILLLALLGFTSCSNCYEIEGRSSVSLLDGRMLFLKVAVGDKLVNIDSAEVVHGSFQMSGKIDSVVIASLYMDTRSIMPIVIEKGKIAISIDNTNIYAAGTPLNNSLYEYMEKRATIESSAYELERKESRMIMEGVSLQEIQSKMNKERQGVLQEMNALNKAFIQKNYTNLLGPSAFLMVCDGYERPILTNFLKQILEEAPSCFKENNQIRSYIEAARDYTRNQNEDSEVLTSGHFH